MDKPHDLPGAWYEHGLVLHLAVALTALGALALWGVLAAAPMPTLEASMPSDLGPARAASQPEPEDLAQVSAAVARGASRLAEITLTP